MIVKVTFVNGTVRTYDASSLTLHMAERMITLQHTTVQDPEYIKLGTVKILAVE